MHSSVLPLSTTVLPHVPLLVSALLLQYTLLLGICPRYLPVVLVSGFPRPLEGAACRDPTSGLRCVSVPLWWRELVDPWPISTTCGSCYTLTSSGQPLLVYQSTPPLSSPYIYCPHSVLFVTSSYPSLFLSGLPYVSISVLNSYPPTSNWPLIYTAPLIVTSA